MYFIFLLITGSAQEPGGLRPYVRCSTVHKSCVTPTSAHTGNTMELNRAASAY